MGYRYEQPDNEDDFEKLCLRFYRKHWGNGNLGLYGKRGERQDGVDIYDEACLPPVRAVQCKHHEPTKSLAPSEIKAEVAKAEKSSLPIEEFLIATTAKKSRAAQDTAVALNSRPSRERRFRASLHFWEDICEHVSGYGKFAADLIILNRDTRAELLQELHRDAELRMYARRILQEESEAGGADALGHIEQSFEQRNIDIAAHEISKLPSGDELAALPNEQRYKVLRFRGKLALEREKFSEASRFFEDAYALQPQLEQAKLNRVLSRSLAGDDKGAFALATTYLDEGVVSAAMICRLIEVAPSIDALSEHWERIEQLLETNENVNLALTRKYILVGDRTAAAEAALRAVTISPESPHAHFAVAFQAHNAAASERIDRKSRLQIAHQYYSSALALARGRKLHLLTLEILHNRAAVNAARGSHEEAASDYRAVVAAAHEPGKYATPAVAYFLHRLDFPAAWELLAKLDRSTLDGRLLSAVTEFFSTDDLAERRRQLREIDELARTEWARRSEATLQCVKCYLVLNDAEGAKACITPDFVEGYPFPALSALAWVAVESGDQPTAAALADRALQQSIQDVHPEEMRLLAVVLTRLDRDEQALDLLERIAVPGVLNNDTELFIECAHRLERHDILLRICRELRESGEHDDRLRRMELQLLSRYAPQNALELAEVFARESSSPAYFIAFRNFLAERLKQPELFRLDASRLPRPSELAPEDSDLVVRPYVRAKLYDDALRFLYAQLRHYFNDENAHWHYVSYVLLYGEKTTIAKAPAKVGTDSAALLRFDDARERWVTIESEKPDVARSEFAATTPLATRLIGASVGDQIEFPNVLSSERATIQEVQSKYIRIFQDCIARFNERFPETSFLQQVRLGQPGDLDITPILELSKQRRDYANASVDFYTSNICPLHLFAERLGISELVGLKALATHPRAFVRCSAASAAEFNQAVSSGNVPAAVVLDVSSILTLTLTDSWRYLGPPQRYIVSQSSKELLGHWIDLERDPGKRERGYTSITDDGQLQFQETTEEDIEARRTELAMMLQAIEEHCEIRSTRSVAELPPKRRELYTEVLGFHNVESICIAKDLELTLWTDDHVLALIATAEKGIPRVWTQLMMRLLVRAGKLTNDEFETLSAKLAAWQYRNTVWKPETIVRAGEFAKWNHAHWPFRQCIELLSKSDLTIPARARYALETLRLLRRSNCSGLQETAVVQAILNAVGSYPAVKWMYEHLDQAFPLDPHSALHLRSDFEYWLQQHLM